MRSGPSGTGTPYIELGQERQLCAAILYRALRDWHAVARAQQPDILKALAQDLGYASPCTELLDFFESDWLERLCSELDIPTEVYLASVRHHALAEYTRSSSYYVGGDG